MNRPKVNRNGDRGERRLVTSLDDLCTLADGVPNGRSPRGQLTVGDLGPVVRWENHREAIPSNVNTGGVDVDSVIGGDAQGRDVEFQMVDSPVTDRDHQRIRCAGCGGEVQPPLTDVVREVLLVDFRIVSVRGRPRQRTSVFDRQGVAELVVQVDRDVTPHTCGDGSLTAAEHKVGGGTLRDGDRYVHKFAGGDVVLHSNGVDTDRIGFEEVRHHRAHASVGRRERDGFTRDRIAVLVDHGGRDGEGFVSGDGRRKRCHQQLGWRTCRHGDALRAANKSEACRDGVNTNGARRVETVRSDVADVNAPFHRWALDHGLMVVSDGVEIHGGVGVGRYGSRWGDVHGRDVGGVEQDFRAERGLDGIARIETGVCKAVVCRTDDDPCLLAGDGHARRADVKPKPAFGVDVDNGGGNGIAVIHTGLHAGCAPGCSAGASVPRGRGLRPARIQQRVDAEGNRCGPLSRRPIVNVQSKRCGMHVLIDGERNLRCIKAHGEPAFIGVQGATEGSGSHGPVANEVGVGVLGDECRVLDVGVTEGRNFVAGLHRVGEGVVVVVDMVR